MLLTTDAKRFFFTLHNFCAFIFSILTICRRAGNKMIKPGGWIKADLLAEGDFSCLHHDIWLPCCACSWGQLLQERERERESESNSERGKASLNVGCCVIPLRAPLLFLCLGLHVTVGYFLWWLARINRSSNVHPVSQQLCRGWDFTSANWRRYCCADMRRTGNRTARREECHVWPSLWGGGLFKCQVCMRIC